LASLKNAAVAFSGGVDSTLLLKAAHDALGDRAIAVTVSSAFIARREIREAESFCSENGITQEVITVDESEIPRFTENPPDRCYLCKREIFSRILEAARKHNIAHVLDGSNVDDLGDYRPGLRALQELGIKSPLRDYGLTKAEIRELSHDLGLPTWEKPSYACLASRFMYGESITREKLGMVEQAEELLQSMGFRQMRVRLHGKMARLEIMPDDFSRIVQEEIRTRLYNELKGLGFSYVTLDMRGYRTGSMNETLLQEV
ncbi:MAG: ATP-dependent sacrificial sulfur transferase LarE, partial [Synergistaceae bacterium]|nr:ATP-dependent sacrificial sulfur transferase LarE [Synergistaceae bacterium]